MHQHKTAAQVILILCFVNFVFAAPAVREIHEARDDVMVRVLAEDVGPVVEKRFRFFGITMAPWDDEDWDSGDEGYESALDEPTDEPTDHPSTSMPSPTEPRKIMTPAVVKAAKIATGVGAFAAAIVGLVIIQATVKSKNGTAS
jgi:hypothetical protein